MKTLRTSNWLCRLAVLVGTAALVFGCSGYSPTGKGTYQAPLLSGSTDIKERVELRATVDFGAAVHGAFAANKALTGFVLDANQGSRITATLVADNEVDPVLVIYGPQSATGIWGAAIAVNDDGKDGRNSLISDFTLPAGGKYLIAAGTFDGNAAGDFDMAVGCRGNCTEPQCADYFCDLYCPLGFMTDPDGCPICRCVPEECRTDEDCLGLYPWANATVRCIDGSCVDNDMNCDETKPCPEGFVCEMGPCSAGGVNVPCFDDACPPCLGKCVPEWVPECVTDRDCMDASGAVPARCIDGRCVRDATGCQVNEECPPGNVCLVMCGGVCHSEDPNCDVPPICQGVCVPAEPPACDAATPCPDGFECVMECWAGCASTDPGCVCQPGDPRCDQTNCKGICVPVQKPECFEDVDCQLGGMLGLCIDGRCVYQEIPCDDTMPCPAGMECAMRCQAFDCKPDDPNCAPPFCQGFCVPTHRPECFSDSDCRAPDGLLGRCVDGRCVFEPLMCKDQMDCPPGTRCEWQACMTGCEPSLPGCCFGVCVPDQKPECFSDQDCQDPTVSPDGRNLGRCINGKCVYEPCYCPEVWDPVCAVNQAGIEQTYSNACFAQCDAAKILYAGECNSQKTCLDGIRCEPGFFCDEATGLCLPLPDLLCKTDRECPEGFVCILEPCMGIPCDPNRGSECPPCDGLGHCVPGNTTEKCMLTGCSGEICAPFPISSTCVWLPEYECLRLTTCELLATADGTPTCGFVQNEEYLLCLQGIVDSDGCLDDAACPPGSICEKFCEQGGCKSICRKPDCICPAVLDPVCGSDGVTYDNFCFAICSDARPVHPGACDGTNGGQ